MSRPIQEDHFLISFTDIKHDDFNIFCCAFPTSFNLLFLQISHIIVRTFISFYVYMYGQSISCVSSNFPMPQQVVPKRCLIYPLEIIDRYIGDLFILAFQPNFQHITETMVIDVRDTGERERVIYDCVDAGIQL